MNDIRESGKGVAGSATGAVVGMGGAATAAAVSACCAGPALGPLVVALFGASGAVTLELLRPYTAVLLAFSGLAIGVAFWLNARGARQCAIDRRSTVLRAISRTLVWGSVLVWLGAVVAVLLAARANSNPMKFSTLDSANAPLREAFNRARSEVRVVELVSPTCPICLMGVSKIQNALFANESSSNLAGFTVWVPMLGGQAANVSEAATLAPDPRVSHYWDGRNALGLAYERILPVSNGPAWDVYMIFAPGIVWNSTDPPKPTFWMHQLPITNAPRLDAAVFAARVRAMLVAPRAN
jgi:hypothetical protein